MSKILDNPKEYFDSLPPKEFTNLLDEFGFKYTKIDIEENIKNFIKAIKEKIGFIINLEYEYDSQANEYKIWHDIKPYKEMEFEDLIGNLIYDYFYKYEIYNISFGYKSA